MRPGGERTHGAAARDDGTGRTPGKAPLLARDVRLVAALAVEAPLRITPSVSLIETVTDNRGLNAERRADAITEGRVNLNAALTGPYLRGYVDYGLSGTAHARDEDYNDLRHALAASAIAQVVPNKGYVDVRASIDQRLVSAFGTQSVSPTTRGDDNRAETATASIAPYWTSRLGSFADLDLRYALSMTRSKGTDRGDQTSRTATVRLGDASRRISWGLLATRQEVDFALGRDTIIDSATVLAGWMPHPDFAFTLTGGRERTDLVTLERQSYSTYGVQLRWRPTERTLAQGSWQHRFFGPSHQFSLSHRTPRTVWSLSSSRDLSTGNGEAQVRIGTTYDLMFQQFASVEPDPIRRDLLVRSFLTSRGIDPRLDVQVGLLVSAVTLQREDSLAFSLLGRHLTVTTQFARSRNSSLSRFDSGVALGELASGRVEQRAATTNVSYRLSPRSAVDATVGWTRSTGESTGTVPEVQGTRLRSLQLNWSLQLTPRSAVSLGARHARFDSPTSPYEENALLASFTQRF